MTSSNKTILIIEDTKTISELLSFALSKHGFVVKEAANGVDGLKDALDDHPDLILLDLILPDIDGVTVLKNLRENEWGKTANVIMLTNMNINEEKVLNDAMQYEPAFYLSKSDMEIGEIVDKVREALGDENL